MKKMMYAILLLVPLCSAMGISAMADKVSKAIAERKYSPANLSDWYLKGKLVGKTKGAISKADYEAYIATLKQRGPVPPFKPAQQVVVKEALISAAQKEALINEIAQGMLHLFIILDPATSGERSEAISDEILKKALVKAQRDYFKHLFGIEPPADLELAQ